MIVTWNVRGFNKMFKHKELKVFMRDNKVDMIAICEHRVKDTKAAKIIRKVLPGWE